MASQQHSGVRSDPGSEINPNRSIIPIDGKSFIVGRYDDQGGKRASAKVVDAVEINEHRKLVNNSMRTRGGELLPGFVMGVNGPIKTTQVPQPNKLKVDKVKNKIVKPKLVKVAKPVKVKNDNFFQTIEDSLTV